ncbi:MAG: hypothetical protein QOF76_4054 [Solirubrobacteraceae bacterium]|jgi:hypothetical protein|nr:hypothetical protein [Solirubrobacteraceae bacterium]
MQMPAFDLPTIAPDGELALKHIAADAGDRAEPADVVSARRAAVPAAA